MRYGEPGTDFSRAAVRNLLVQVELSVIVPVHNEQDNVVPLLEEITAALASVVPFEAIFIDDFSDDHTLKVLQNAKSRFAVLRIIAHDRNCGQSSAIRSGVLAAKGPLIATLDGDGQNDPADIPRVLAKYKEAAHQGSIGLVSGRRVKRKDSWMKRTASRIGNAIRRFILRDETADTGCALKIFSRETFLLLPYFDHMHRYIPALMQREGLTIEFVDVNHRPRLHGTSNYGIFDRLWVSISDLAGVVWLRRRCRRPANPREY